MKKTNAEILCTKIIEESNELYEDELPSLQQIVDVANTIRKIFSERYPVDDDEFESIKRKVQEVVLHSFEDDIHSLKGEDSEHEKGWYLLNDNGTELWDRFSKYLSSKWGKKTVTDLHHLTDKIMDDLGDPLNPNPFQRRGLLLGEVQSGKTATYTAICNKAADAGYKVIIVLAGILEILRRQTQSRLDEEFVGRNSEYTLDKKVILSKKNTPVGVGHTKIVKKEKDITPFTSIKNDFNTDVVKANFLDLNNLKGTALFVVKKNARILDNLFNWLSDEELNNLPLLLIDDEADNASINTNDPDLDPTAINFAIKNILNSFKRATYLGITATPFANILIDSDSYDNGVAKDLFPRHFLTILPSHENYIGVEKIFGQFLLDDDPPRRKKGVFDDSLVKISKDEMKKYFKYGHKIDLAYHLDSLPESLKEAIQYFVLVTGVSDFRKDTKEHRTMLVNVSRYTEVQNRVSELIEEYLTQLKADVDCYAQIKKDKRQHIDTICSFENIWNKYGLCSILDFDSYITEYLNKAIRRIEIRTVNQSSGSSSLDYNKYKGTGLRVIVVGGNSLSRGLTLEGLITSYFYRNTKMYDTLLQMGRWFGRRPNYSDLFKIWIGTDSITWYSKISSALIELRNDLKDMEKKQLSPYEYRLKVRKTEGALLITARNKMKKSETLNIPITISGQLIETAAMIDNDEIIKKNNEICESFIKKILNKADFDCRFDSFVNATVWKNIPNTLVADLVKNYQAHYWSKAFHSSSLSDLILDKAELWSIGIPLGNDNVIDKGIRPSIDSIKKHFEVRPLKRDPNKKKRMLQAYGHHARIGSGGCTRIGLDEEKIKEIISNNENKKITNETYLNTTRQPILLIHRMKNSCPETKDDLPAYVYALGLGFPDDGKKEKTALYVINTTQRDLFGLYDVDSVEEEDEDGVDL